MQYKNLNEVLAAWPNGATHYLESSQQFFKVNTYGIYCQKGEEWVLFPDMPTKEILNSMITKYEVTIKSNSQAIKETSDLASAPTAHKESDTASKYPHYFKDVSHLKVIDVYRVLDLFGVTDHAIGHAAKKLLCTGKRGAKDTRKDIEEARNTLNRVLSMYDENSGIANPKNFTIGTVVRVKNGSNSKIADVASYPTGIIIGFPPDSPNAAWISNPLWDSQYSYSLDEIEILE